MVIDESFTDRRIGYFTLPGSTVRERPDPVRALMMAIKFIPLEVQHMGHQDSYLFVGISPQFEQLEVNAIPPGYEITVHKPGKKGPSVSVTRL